MNKSLYWLLVVSPLTLGAEVYKCVGPDGSATYTSILTTDKNCAAVELKVSEPNPADVARALEQKRQQDEAEQTAERDRREQEAAQAQALAAEAAMRRANAAEEELRDLRQQQQGGTYLQPTYPAGLLTYPYSQSLPYSPYLPYQPFPNRPFPFHPFPDNGPYPAMPNDGNPPPHPGGPSGPVGPHPPPLRVPQGLR
jgi:hypothetical protein